MDILAFLQDLFLLKYLPKLGNNTSYGLLLIFGILTSFHCIGMCGGIALSQTAGKIEAESPGNRLHTVIGPSLFYNLGRVIAYTVVGGIVGGLGYIISFSGVWKGIVPIIGGIFMIIMAINILDIFPFLRWLNIRVPAFFARKIYKGNNYSPIIVGLLTGLMPCGPLQMIQLYALSTGSVIYGAASMFIFAIGTVPLVFLFGALNTFLNKKFAKTLIKVSAVLVFTLGIVMIGRGLALTGISFGMTHTAGGETVFAVVNGNSQTVRTQLKPDSFPPIVVVKGLPVKWIINVDKENLNDCNNEFQAPKLNIEKKLVVGDNTVEFTPAEAGDFIYTCWMGMIKSKITVIDSIEALKKAQTEGISASETVPTLVPAPSDPVPAYPDPTLPAPTPSAAESGQSAFESAAPTTETATNPQYFSAPAVQKFTGFIIDEDCYINYSDPGEDTKTCLLMSSCAASGYGIAVLQSDGSYKFYYFDGSFAPQATGAQAEAYKLIKNTLKKNQVSISVTGSLKGDTKTAADGKSYPVITVSSLTEN